MLAVKTWGEESRRREWVVYGQVQIGNVTYQLKDDKGTQVAKATDEILVATIGSRVYLSGFAGIGFYIGPELVYTNLALNYPSNYADDKTTAARITIGGAGD